MELIDFRFDPGPLFGVVVFLGLFALGFLIWMLVDAIGRPESDFSSSGAKTGWIAGMVLGLVFGFGFVGVAIAIAYLVSVRLPARERERSGRPVPPERPGPPATGGTPPPPPGAPQRTAAYCPNCGAKVVAGARFCHSCGTAIPEVP